MNKYLILFFVIGDTTICKTYVIKFVIFLALLKKKKFFFFFVLLKIRGKKNLQLTLKKNLLIALPI